jgi:hypothetical protein
MRKTVTALVLAGAMVLGASAVAAQAAPAKPAKPGVMCKVSYRIYSKPLNNYSHSGTRKPYVLSFGSRKNATSYCRQGSTWEQYGTSRCLVYRNTTTPTVGEGDCKSGQAKWTTPVTAGGRHFRSTFNFGCVTDVAGGRRAFVLTCLSPDISQAFRFRPVRHKKSGSACPSCTARTTVTAALVPATSHHGDLCDQGNYGTACAGTLPVPKRIPVVRPGAGNIAYGMVEGKEGYCKRNYVTTTCPFNSKVPALEALNHKYRGTGIRQFIYTDESSTIPSEECPGIPQDTVGVGWQNCYFPPGGTTVSNGIAGAGHDRGTEWVVSGWTIINVLATNATHHEQFLCVSRKRGRFVLQEKRVNGICQLSINGQTKKAALTAATVAPSVYGPNGAQHACIGSARGETWCWIDKRKRDSIVHLQRTGDFTNVTFDRQTRQLRQAGRDGQCITYVEGSRGDYVAFRDCRDGRDQRWWFTSTDHGSRVEIRTSLHDGVCLTWNPKPTARYNLTSAPCSPRDVHQWFFWRSTPKPTAAVLTAATAKPSDHNFVAYFAGEKNEDFYLAKRGNPLKYGAGSRIRTCYGTDESNKVHADMSKCDLASHFYEEDLGTIGVDGYAPFPHEPQNTIHKGVTIARLWYMVYDKNTHGFRRTDYCVNPGVKASDTWDGTVLDLEPCKVSDITWRSMWMLPQPITLSFPTFTSTGIVSFYATRSIAQTHPTSSQEPAAASNFRKDAPQVFLLPISPTATVARTAPAAWIPARRDTPAIPGACASAAKTWPGPQAAADESCSRNVIPDDISHLGADLKVVDIGGVYHTEAWITMNVHYRPLVFLLSADLQYWHHDRWITVDEQDYSTGDVPEAGAVNARMNPRLEDEWTRGRWRILVVTWIGRSDTGHAQDSNHQLIYLPSRPGRLLKRPE